MCEFLCAYFVLVLGKPFKQVAKKSTSLPPQSSASRGVQNHSIARHRSGSGVVSDDDDEGVFSRSSVTDSNGHCGVATSRTSVNHDSSHLTESCVKNGVYAKTKNVSETKLPVMNTASHQSVDEDSDGVVIISDIADCDNNHKSNDENKVVVRSKRPFGATGGRTEITGHKKVCLDQKNGASISVKKKIIINRKVKFSS